MSRQEDHIAENPLQRVLQRLPGGRSAWHYLTRLEHRLLSEFKQRLDRLEQEARAERWQLPVTIVGAAAQAASWRLRELLAISEEQDRDQAEIAYFQTVLQRLLPDQARILSALADGTAYPLLTVEGGARFGVALSPVVEFVSSVGKRAGARCPDLTPAYLAQLHAFGLIEIETGVLADTLQYEMLETETSVRNAIDQLKKSGRRGRIVRGSLRISPLGARLWASCGPVDN